MNKFKFYHFTDENFMYTATRKGEEYTVTWDDHGTGNKGSAIYDETDVDWLISEGYWKVVETIK